MKKPKYMEELLKIIFLWLGVVFVCVGIICFIGVLNPKESSVVQVSTLLGGIFSLIGMFFIITSVILGAIATEKSKLHCDLLASGTKIKGEVEKVYLQKNTQFGRQSPYRIMYVYTYQDKVCHSKSYFIWEKPKIMTGDSIVIYTNDFGKTTIEL